MVSQARSKPVGTCMVPHDMMDTDGSAWMDGWMDT
jgi:hypothetical protein